MRFTSIPCPAFLALAVACGFARTAAADLRDAPSPLFAFAPGSFAIGGAYQVDDFGGGSEGDGAWVAADDDWSDAGDPLLRLEIVFGALIPFEDSDMAFGADTSNEDFDAGGLFGVRIQGPIAPFLRFGAEMDFAAHDVDAGQVFFPGDMARLYFLFPLTLEVPFGNPELPASIAASIAPGVQIAFPEVDHFVEDFEALRGRFIDEEDFAGFTLRAAVVLRVPLSIHVRLFVETSFDWAFGDADVEVFNSIGQRIEVRSGDIDLSALHVLGGVSFAF